MTELRIGDKVILNIATFGEPLYGVVTAKFDSTVVYPREKPDKRLPQTEVFFVHVYKAEFVVPGRDYPTTRVFDQNAIWDGYILIDDDKPRCGECKHRNKDRILPKCDMFNVDVELSHYCHHWVKE
jgi:hypothetical protein